MAKEPPKFHHTQPKHYQPLCISKSCVGDHWRLPVQASCSLRVETCWEKWVNHGVSIALSVACQACDLGEFGPMSSLQSPARTEVEEHL
eukprot:1610181-Amphidinium_carterae.1